MDSMTLSSTTRRLPALAALATTLLLVAVPQAAVADPDEDTAFEQRRVAMQMANAGRLGDAVRAGNDLVDATVVAVQAGNSIRAWDTAEKVGYVLRTADLLPEERLAILERITVEQGPAIQG